MRQERECEGMLEAGTEGSSDGSKGEVEVIMRKGFFKRPK